MYIICRHCTVLLLIVPIIQGLYDPLYCAEELKSTPYSLFDSSYFGAFYYVFLKMDSTCV